VSRKHWYLAIGASAVLLLLLRKKASAAAAAPSVAGTLTVGDASLVIDDNVMSPNFGLPINAN